MTELQTNMQAKLLSGLYNFSQITRDTKISRHWLNGIKYDGKAPDYILVALNEYFKRTSNDNQT